MAVPSLPWMTSWWQNWLPKTVKETLTNTSLSSITLSNMQRQKGQQTCCNWCYEATWIIVGQTGSSWVVAFGELLGTMGAACDLYEVRWECHPEQCHPSQDQVHESWTEEDAMENWGNGAIQSASWGGASGPTVEWRTEVRDWIQKDNALTSRQGAKQKKKNNPVGWHGCCTWAQWCEWWWGYQWMELTNQFHIQK